MAKAPPSSPVAVPQSRTARPSGPAVPAYTHTGRKFQADMPLHRRPPVLAVDVLHAGQPAVEHARVGLPPHRPHPLLVLAVCKDGPHDGAITQDRKGAGMGRRVSVSVELVG